MIVKKIYAESPECAKAHSWRVSGCRGPALACRRHKNTGRSVDLPAEHFVDNDLAYIIYGKSDFFPGDLRVKYYLQEKSVQPLFRIVGIPGLIQNIDIADDFRVFLDAGAL